MKTNLRRLVMAMIPVLMLLGCPGPRPHLIEAHIRSPETASAPYIVEATLRNEGSGQGEAEVIVRISDSSGKTFQKQEKVQFEKNESIQIAVEFNAPKGDYVPRIEIVYPSGL